jgi:hypothetical protein
MENSKRRMVENAGSVAAVLLGGAVAVAFWTTTGSGTGAGDVGSDIPVTVSQDSTVSGLVPGGPAAPLDFTVSSTAPGPQQISDVAISVTVDGSPAGCTAADFSITQPSKPSGGTPLAVPANGSLSFTSAGAGPTGGTGAAIAMVNSGTNQDACKNVDLTLTYAVS